MGVGRCHASRAARATIDPAVQMFSAVQRGRQGSSLCRQGSRGGEVEQWAELLSGSKVGMSQRVYSQQCGDEWVFSAVGVWEKRKQVRVNNCFMSWMKGPKSKQCNHQSSRNEIALDCM